MDRRTGGPIVVGLTDRGAHYAGSVPSVSDEAICLRVWDYSETSQTVALFTRAHGLVRGLAKGSKRERSAYSGGFEMLTFGELSFIERPSTGLAVLTEWDLRDGFFGLRSSLRAYYAAAYAGDLVYQSVTDADPHPGLFVALRDALTGLGTSGVTVSRAWAQLAALQWSALRESGYKPDLEPAVGGDALVAFNAELGRFEALPRGSSVPPGWWGVRPETVEVLLALSEGHRADGIGEASAETLKRVNRLLASYLARVIGKKLDSATALFDEAG